jgi:hypothetical protein
MRYAHGFFSTFFSARFSLKIRRQPCLRDTSGPDVLIATLFVTAGNGPRPVGQEEDMTFLTGEGQMVSPLTRCRLVPSDTGRLAGEPTRWRASCSNPAASVPMGRRLAPAVSPYFPQDAGRAPQSSLPSAKIVSRRAKATHG